MARHQSHLIKLTDIPGRDDNTTTVGCITNQVDGILNLVNHSPVVCFPLAPLLTVYRPEVAFFVSPFVPDSDLVILELTDIGIS